MDGQEVVFGDLGTIIEGLLVRGAVLRCHVEAFEKGVCCLGEVAGPCI